MEEGRQPCVSKYYLTNFMSRVLEKLMVADISLHTTSSFTTPENFISIVSWFSDIETYAVIMCAVLYSVTRLSILILLLSEIDL